MSIFKNKKDFLSFEAGNCVSNSSFKWRKIQLKISGRGEIKFIRHFTCCCQFLSAIYIAVIWLTRTKCSCWTNYCDLLILWFTKRFIMLMSYFCCDEMLTNWFLHHKLFVDVSLLTVLYLCFLAEPFSLEDQTYRCYKSFIIHHVRWFVCMFICYQLANLTRPFLYPQSCHSYCILYPDNQQVVFVT